MPWTVKKDNRCPASKPWAVVKDSDNKLQGCHISKAKAGKQLSALNASKTGKTATGSTYNINMSFSDPVNTSVPGVDTTNTTEKKAVSFDELRNRVSIELNDKFGSDDSIGPWIAEMFDEFVIAEFKEGKFWRIPYTATDENIEFADRDEWEKVAPKQVWIEAKAMRDPGNALKAISETDEELRVANRIILFGGRDLEGIMSRHINPDGSKGEYFTEETVVESEFTKAGQLPVNWHHGVDSDENSPGDQTLGYVDWKTAKRDKLGIWVERVLDKRNKYIQALSTLIKSGLIGTSSEAVPTQIGKAANGEITVWPLKGDALTVMPMDARMITDNTLEAIKSLAADIPQFVNIAKAAGIELDNGKSDEGSSAGKQVAIAKAKAHIRLIELSGV